MPLEVSVTDRPYGLRDDYHLYTNHVLGICNYWSLGGWIFNYTGVDNTYYLEFGNN